VHWTWHKKQQQQQQQQLKLLVKTKACGKTYLFINMCCVPAVARLFEFIVDVIGSSREFWFISRACPPAPAGLPSYSTGLRFNHVRAMRTWCDSYFFPIPHTCLQPHAAVEAEAEADAHVDAALVLQMLPWQTPSQPASEPLLQCWSYKEVN